MAKTMLPALLLAAFILGITSCCLEPSVPVVYVAGWYSAGTSVAAYWKDDEAGLRTLHDTSNAQAASVFVADGDVYVAGYYTNAWSKQAAAYWVNGDVVDLHSTATGNAQAKSIAVSGSDVYVAGWVNEGTQSAVLWKNGTPIMLHETNASNALGLAVSDSDVFVAGYYSPPSKDVSCWWKIDAADNVAKVDLYADNYSRANGITLSGGDVYVAGYYIPLVGNITACYWKNGSAGKVDLIEKGQSTSVFLLGTDIYVAGYYSNTINNGAAVYWRNGTLNVLYSDTVTSANTAQAFSIQVAGGAIYIAGQVTEGTKVACYWKNSERVDLYPTGESSASSIFVD